MKAWKRFCLQQHENRELCDIPGDELNLLLSKFFETVKKRQQLHFQQFTLRQLCRQSNTDSLEEPRDRKR